MECVAPSVPVLEGVPEAEAVADTEDVGVRRRVEGVGVGALYSGSTAAA